MKVFVFLKETKKIDVMKRLREEVKKGVITSKQVMELVKDFEARVKTDCGQYIHLRVEEV